MATILNGIVYFSNTLDLQYTVTNFLNTLETYFGLGAGVSNARQGQAQADSNVHIDIIININVTTARDYVNESIRKCGLKYIKWDEF